jgi:hypothetical protein
MGKCQLLCLASVLERIGPYDISCYCTIEIAKPYRHAERDTPFVSSLDIISDPCNGVSFDPKVVVNKGPRCRMPEQLTNYRIDCPSRRERFSKYV